MKKHRYPGFQSATLEFDIEDFNPHVLQQIRNDAKTHASLPSYVVAADDILDDAAELSGEKIVVIPLCGRDSDAIDHAYPDIYSAVHPRANGARIACLMLGGGQVALTHMAPHRANASLYDNLNVLWLFDDEPSVSQYYISEDLLEGMTQKNAIEEDHNPLTQEEVRAWQKVAAEASHLGFFEVADLTNPACPHREAILAD
ncbi:hypothetical protein [Paraburkholderia pallida]|uniref:Uncharacterized protein n=1 Tax=Paraburkholderia pallida TaxID=2547399 RepID=A0A4P7DA67_9BURK|nr:hypothetical protein [Paraburkholderia pallida]QBR03612.1 hypothetical protein E1956_41615 [Paraburkholderia pallida]